MNRNSHISAQDSAVLPARGLSLLCAAALLGGILLISLFVSVSISQAGNDSVAVNAGQPPTTHDYPPVDLSDQKRATLDLAAYVYRIMVQADGIYQMTYADLHAAGLPVDILDPRNFHLSWMGEEVAIRVVGEEDGRFDPQDAVIFYGQGIGSAYRDGRLPTQKYTDTNVYWLTVNGKQGKRMAIKDGAVDGMAAGPFRHQIHLEQDKLYMPAWPTKTEADHWYWDAYQVFKSRPVVTRPYTFTTTGLATDSLTGTLTIRLLGAQDCTDGSTPPSAIPIPIHVRVHLNGHLFDDPPISYEDILTPTLDVPQGWFAEDTNSITVTLIYEAVSGCVRTMIWSDWLDVTYYDTHVAEEDALVFTNDVSGAWRYTISGFTGSDIEVYDVSDMTAAQYFTNTSAAGVGPYTLSFGDDVTGARRYLALRPDQRLRPTMIERPTHLTSPYTPADLWNPGRGADYILISHGDFWAQAQTLAEHRAKSHTVALVDVQEIYDQFSGGLLSAEAIRDFLAHAYDNWPEPRPAYVLLLGDGTYDVRQRLGNSLPTYIPPFMAWSDFEEPPKELAIDNRFVTIIGGDEILELYLGRLPANSPAEAQAMVDKIIAYETTPPVDNFNQHVLFVADRLDLGGGDFHRGSDELADGYADPPSNTVKYLPPQYIPHKVYLGRTCTLADAAECRAAITQTLDITGALVTNYIGHGYLDKWAEDLLLTRRAIDDLTNGERLPVMLAMACGTAFFAEPDPSRVSIGETAVRDAGRGAVAYLGRTGSGLFVVDQAGERALFRALFYDEMALGPAIERGRQAANRWKQQSEDPPQDSFARTWTLLGDPALKLQLVSPPVSDYQISKSVSAARTDFQYGDAVSFTIQITNTGNTWITTLPLRDVYDPAYLTYGPCGGGHNADPQPDDYLDDGQLDWSDLTAPAPHGFGTDLAPGASFTVIVTFTAASDTTALPARATGNRAEVHNSKADPGGPGSSLPEVTLPDKASSIQVAIETLPFISELMGVVWHDANGDGERNGDSEPGIDGVKLNIYWDDGDVNFEPEIQDAFYGTTHTGPGEEWPFAERGAYRIRLPHAPHYCRRPSFLWIEVDERGSIPADILEGMALTTDQTYGPDPMPVPLRETGGVLWPMADGDFGYARLASVGGMVWWDVDDSGQRNPGEEGIPSVQVNLYNGPDGRIAVATTDASGQYTFMRLPPGAYRVEVDASAFEPNGALCNWSASPQDAGGADDATDSDGHTTNHDVAIDLGWEQAVTATDFGFYLRSTGLTVSQFGAAAQEGHVRLTWDTASEVNILGFNVLRQAGDNGEFQTVNSELIFAEQPGRDAGAQYGWADENVIPRVSYQYTLVLVRLDGNSEEFETVSVAVPGQ